MTNDLNCKIHNTPPFNSKFGTLFLLFLVTVIMTLVVSEIDGINYAFANNDNENENEDDASTHGDEWNMEGIEGLDGVNCIEQGC
jgi:hypothetical protein